ncbi:hypothetical protein Z046_00155 [Pseudomonas aeruginosa VRFPA09]|nr:hypothetical protein Z046_00155 [Pseudomonas aeruginosa VRFPA09]
MQASPMRRRRLRAWLRLEHPAMATGLDALGDHRIGAGGLHQSRFLRRGGTDQYADARRLQRANLVAGRRAEMEADRRRPLFQQHRQQGRVFEEAQVDVVQARRRLGAELGEQRLQVVQPGALAGRVGLPRAVAEQVDVERLVGQPAHLADQRPAFLGGATGDGDRTEPAGVGYGGGQRRRGDAEHGCLDDRLLDAEQAREAVSHGDSLSRSDDTASADA